MTRILTQDEVDNLLRGLSGGLPELTPAQEEINSGNQPFSSPAELEEYLLSEAQEAGRYGSFSAQSISVFNDPDGDATLLAIMTKNAEHGMGNVRIPGTGLELINYSKCPSCRMIMSFKDLSAYYRNPGRIFRIEGMNEVERKYKDTRVFCPICKTPYLPSLVILNRGKAKYERQYMCKLQTMYAVEETLLKKRYCVLSTNPKNLSKTPDGLYHIRNDVPAGRLRDAPSLIANMLQYMPPEEMLAFASGKNLDEQHPLFGGHRFRAAHPNRFKRPGTVH